MAALQTALVSGYYNEGSVEVCSAAPIRRCAISEDKIVIAQPFEGIQHATTYLYSLIVI